MPNPTLAGGTAARPKATCSKCKRTVYVEVVAGLKIFTDPELIAVIAFEALPSLKILARRVHDEMCVRYQVEEERKAIKAKAIARAARVKR